MKKSPGRPPVQNKAAKNSSRHRQYSIVIHDIKKGLKALVDSKLGELKPDWRLVAQENYTHQEGSHLHIFIKYKERKAFSTVLKFFKDIAETNDAGRVQVDTGRGSFAECEKYLINPDKEKNLDDNIIKDVRRKTKQEIYDGLAVKYPGETQKCSTCSKSVFVGKPMLFKTSGGEISEIISPAYCWICQKIKNSENLRRARPELFSQEMV